MARVAITPTWVRILDFSPGDETRLPSAIARAIERSKASAGWGWSSDRFWHGRAAAGAAWIYRKLSAQPIPSALSSERARRQPLHQPLPV